MGSPQRIAEDPYHASVSGIGFVIQRTRPYRWEIEDLANTRYDILSLAVSGSASYSCRGETIEVQRGTMLFFPRGTPHSGRSAPRDPWTFFSAGFRIEPHNEEIAERIEKLPWHGLASNPLEMEDEFHSLRRMWVKGGAGFSLACQGLIMRLFSRYVRTVTKRGEEMPHAGRLAEVVERLHANIGMVYSVSELAGQAGISESRFRRLFREYTGYSFTLYQNRLRIQAAEDLLLSGRYTVSEAAEELGFRDIYYFSRLFKRITGLPPSDYRNY